MTKSHWNTRHGHWCDGKATKTYRTWFHIKQRCNNPNNIGYDRYGGRGIKVCKRWNTFDNFLEDVGEVPDGMTIDRIDNDGNYEPNNVRFVSPKQQANNRSSNKHLTIDGETKTIAEWADITGIPYRTIHNRQLYGWADKDCILPANSTRNVFLTVKGQTKTITEWAKVSGLTKSIISKRKKAGWSDEDCLKPSKRKKRS